MGFQATALWAPVPDARGPSRLLVLGLFFGVIKDIAEPGAAAKDAAERLKDGRPVGEPEDTPSGMSSAVADFSADPLCWNI